MFDSLYPRLRTLAEGPRAEAALAAVAFAERSFFPIPPDVLLAPMALANPGRAWRYAGLRDRRPTLRHDRPVAHQPLRLWHEDGRAEGDLRPVGVARDPDQGRNPHPL